MVNLVAQIPDRRGGEHKEIRVVLTPTLGAMVELLIDNRTRIEQLPSGKVELQIIRGKEDQVKLFLREKAGQKRVLHDEE